MGLRMSTSRLKYVILPYEGSVEKLVDVRKTIPQGNVKGNFSKIVYIFNGNWADALVGFIIRHMGHDCDVLYWHAGSG